MVYPMEEKPAHVTAGRTTGLAFSGGGIRSAAFCSGVLRRLLQKSASIDYISTVSGGGFTGVSYLDWKVRNGNRDDPVWHKEFFEHIRGRINFYCDWRSPCQGMLDLVLFTLLVTMTSIVLPVLIWAPYAYPLAFCVEYILGDIIRGKDLCPNSQIDCKEKGDALIAYRNALFTSTGVGFVILYIISKRIHGTVKGYVRLFAVLLGVIFYLSFAPWINFLFLTRFPFWLKILFVPASLIFWVIFPMMRSKVLFMIFMYWYSFITYWRVYARPIFNIPYNHENFDFGLCISGIFIWISPTAHLLQQTAAFTYTRWRMQRSFSHPTSAGSCGCRGIGLLELCRYALPCRTRLPDKRPLERRSLTLADLTQVSPRLISNITVNEWRYTAKSASYDLLLFSPDGIESIDPRETYQTSQFNNRLTAHHVKVTEAMLISAGALAKRMGELQTNMEVASPTIAMTGLAMGASVPMDRTLYDGESIWIRCIPLLAKTVRFVPLVVFPLLDLIRHADEHLYTVIGIIAYLSGMILATLIAVQRTGSPKPDLVERFIRWVVAHDSLVYFLRSTIEIMNIGPNPPPVLELSDGGHFENLGLLPLLKRRLKKIVVVDAGQKDKDEDYANDLLVALRLARDRLHCSFIGHNGRDVIEDIREQFGQKMPGDQPRSYRFRVEYYQKDSVYSESVKVGEGEILLVAPRHPSKGKPNNSKPMSWDDFGIELESNRWGTGPEVTAQEADGLTGCCCECCHGKPVLGALCACIGTFPAHSTLNQLFTPSTFTAYHREGYRACAEAAAAEFLGVLDTCVTVVTTEPQPPVTTVEVVSNTKDDVKFHVNGHVNEAFESTAF